MTNKLIHQQLNEFSYLAPELDRYDENDLDYGEYAPMSREERIAADLEMARRDALNIERQAQAGDLVDERMLRGDQMPDEEDEEVEEGGEEPGMRPTKK